MTRSRSRRDRPARPGAPKDEPARRPAPTPEPEALAPEEAGALRIGPTDLGMVRFIIATHQGVIELDYAPDDAREIAAELIAAADAAETKG